MPANATPEHYPHWRGCGFAIYNLGPIRDGDPDRTEDFDPRTTAYGWGGVDYCVRPKGHKPPHITGSEAYEDKHAIEDGLDPETARHLYPEVPWPPRMSDAVTAMLNDERAPTAPLDEFREALEIDSNLWWRISCGHHENLFDEAVDRLLEQKEPRACASYLLHGVADRDPDELVCMLFPDEESRDEFKADLPGKYLELTLGGVDYDAIVINQD
jgi:hypothetical protein